jgi:integrase
MRSFNLYRRNGVFYCRFYNPIKKAYTGAISTRETSRNAAMAVVALWELSGIPTKDNSRKTPESIVNLDILFHSVRQAPLTKKDANTIIKILEDRGLLESDKPLTDADQPFLSFLETFWDYDRSPYVKEKQAYGQRIGRRHCKEQTKLLSHWRKYLSPDMTARALTRETLSQFQLKLRETLAPKTANAVLSAGSTVLKWLHDRGDLPNDAGAGLRRFAGQSKKRDVFSQAEAKKLFSVEWKDERSRVANLLAMTSGMRAGEILGLRQDAIKSDRIEVNYSWSPVDGMKPPKNGESRTVPLMPFVREELLRLAAGNPHGPDGFIFYQADPEKPMRLGSLVDFMREAFIDSHLPEEERNNSEKREAIRRELIDRGVCFHSWRHFFTANLADHVEMRAVMLSTGHKTVAVAEAYANHQNAEHFRKTAEALTEVFGNVVPFPATSGTTAAAGK